MTSCIAGIHSKNLEAITAFIPERNRKISLSKWPEFLEHEVLPFARKYKVDFDKSLMTELIQWRT